MAELAELRHRLLSFPPSASPGCLKPQFRVGAVQLRQEQGQPGGVAILPHGVKSAHPELQIAAVISLADHFGYLWLAQGADGLQGSVTYLKLLILIVKGGRQSPLPLSSISCRQLAKLGE